MMARSSTRSNNAASSSAVRQRHSLSILDQSAAESQDDSDKENSVTRTIRGGIAKRKHIAVNMSSQVPNTQPSKRRRVAAGSQDLEGQNKDGRYYDPDQDEIVKRDTTKRLRELNANLNDSRAEFLRRGNTGLRDTAIQADDIYEHVKQTHVATIDSRLLVNVGDLAYKKISTLTLGDSSTGIDVDDFLSKCAHFMRMDHNTSRARTDPDRRQPTRSTNGGLSDDEEHDDDHAELDWGRLGRMLCFPANRRPCLSSFLLGPLSVQKKVRNSTQRRATQRTQITGPTTRPVELDQETVDKQESASLTQVCTEIATLLARTQKAGEEAVDSAFEEIQANGQELADEDIKQLMRKHNMADNGGIPLFTFCVNPLSFGQTVENFFYTSFLVKEGRVGLDFDSDGLPTLGMVATKGVEERQESVRNQAVFTLDFETWEEIVQSFDIRRCIIPHRRQEAWELDDGVVHMTNTVNNDDNT